MLTMPAFRGLHPNDSGSSKPCCLLRPACGSAQASCSTKTWKSQHHDGCSHMSLHFWSQEKTNQSLWFALCLYCWTIHQSQSRFQLAESVIEFETASFEKKLSNCFRREWIWTYRKTFSLKHQIASIASYPPTAFGRHAENASWLSGLWGFTREGCLTGRVAVTSIHLWGSKNWPPPRGGWAPHLRSGAIRRDLSFDDSAVYWFLWQSLTRQGL